MRYFITFSCYGARLHGDESGSVDRSHNLFGGRMLEPDAKLVASERLEMIQAPYVLDHAGREAVLAAIRKHCSHRNWKLLAAHVRSNHVHVIVDADSQPERVMNEFKSYASRELNHLTNGGAERKRWARHGSTRWLWKDQDVREALRYVIDEQGEPMALFVSEEL